MSDILSIQKYLFNMISDFHAFCINNNLVYYMASGTMLGAIRHQGFIPWDDDVDIYMLREDYDKLINSLYIYLPKSLELKSFRNTDSIPMHYAKLIAPGTTLVEKKFGNYIEGVYIDIFPLDGYNPNRIIDRLRWGYARFLNSIVITKFQTTPKAKRYKELFHSICKYFDDKKLHRKIEKLITADSQYSTVMVGDYLGAYNKKEVFQRDLFNNASLYSFGDTELYGIRDYDRYLRQMYGDYLSLPPIEQRINQHETLVLDFFTPYREYKRQTERTKHESANP